MRSQGDAMNPRPVARRRFALAAAIGSMALLCTPVSAGDGHDGRDGRDGRDDHDESQVRRGFELVPKGVALNLAGKNRALVGLGSYVVNTSGCIDCHSHPSYAPGGDPFKGEPEIVNAQQYLSGGRTFGPFTAANLTPDYAGRPAGLTLKQFLITLRTGHNPNDPPGEILQVMPWPVYGKKTERDLTAIYEFLRAIPSLPDNPNPGP
jgi:hypothetical protein